MIGYVLQAERRYLVNLAQPLSANRTYAPAMAMAASALRIGFGAEPVLIREGGTIPVVAMLKSLLGVDSLLVGFGLPDDNLHGPNEKFGLDCLRHGTRSAAALYANLAGLRRE